ncbi:hypothetical protein OXPF_34670 [Oxobacter pfennigii]|uniref:Uncharacterized protein n=1 Tax=Oxobacter pfennigii TaxID=36849 RepID=A0A0P8W5S6_9CLOT|nr:DUF3006 domain-containing protein [Oxobacter pfennigii]KPU43035.1 hypothetical protein OXPF_34670 [Oxobacter pfennigii]
MKVIIDRFEGNYAIVEMPGRKMVDIEISKIPAGVKAEDVINIADDKISIDATETSKRKKRIEELTKDLWK